MFDASLPMKSAFGYFYASECIMHVSCKLNFWSNEENRRKQQKKTSCKSRQDSICHRVRTQYYILYTFSPFLPNKNVRFFFIIQSISIYPLTLYTNNNMTHTHTINECIVSQCWKINRNSQAFQQKKICVLHNQRKIHFNLLRNIFSFFLACMKSNALHLLWRFHDWGRCEFSFFIQFANLADSL